MLGLLKHLHCKSKCSKCYGKLRFRLTLHTGRIEIEIPLARHNIYRPQRSWGKVMFLHVSVILFTGGNTWAGPPRQVHPPGRYTPCQVHPVAGTHWAGTPPRQVAPQAGTPPGRHPLSRYTPRASISWPQCMLGYSQQAGGTHPTGLHSCFVNFDKNLDRNKELSFQY